MQVWILRYSPKYQWFNIIESEEAQQLELKYAHRADDIGFQIIKTFDTEEEAEKYSIEIRDNYPLSLMNSIYIDFLEHKHYRTVKEYNFNKHIKSD